MHDHTGTRLSGGDDTICRNPREGISGFGSGAMIETSEGPQPVEWLRAGDLVLTRDHGYRPLRWVGRSEMSHAHPIRIFAGAFGKRTPEHDLVLSPHHQILMSSPLVPLYFAEDEVLAPVSAITTEAEEDYVSRNPDHALCHLLFDQHEVVLAEGVWLESLFPDAPYLDLLGRDSEQDMRDAIGTNLDTMITARMVLNSREVALLKPRSAIAARRMVA
ncbi:Hint domain-containing protein [Celeribacter sp.]|uniref:Hint domain-containing protein n=1 Tax=Celeribacter sp. TaxID=1890673 RepID=UPI003A8D972E